MRRAIRVRGAVQGVGFRPFVWRLATDLGLDGFVLDDAEGVAIEAQGEAGALDRFLERLAGEAPRLARIDAIETRPAATQAARGFVIDPSRAGAALELAGASMADVVELTSFHAEGRDTPGFQAELDRLLPIHAEFFGDHYPAWTAVGTTALLAPGAPLEMRAMAVIGSGRNPRADIPKPAPRPAPPPAP